MSGTVRGRRKEEEAEAEEKGAKEKEIVMSGEADDSTRTEKSVVS